MHIAELTHCTAAGTEEGKPRSRLVDNKKTMDIFRIPPALPGLGGQMCYDLRKSPCGVAEYAPEVSKHEMALHHLPRTEWSKQYKERGRSPALPRE